jgi:hypothetical protein
MAHRSRLTGFIIDCETGDLDVAADFWSGALGLAGVGDWKDKTIKLAQKYGCTAW